MLCTHRTVLIVLFLSLLNLAGVASRANASAATASIGTAALAVAPTKPTVSIRATVGSVREPCPPTVVCITDAVPSAQFVITRTAPLQRTMAVFFTIAGTAKNDVDYEGLPEFVLIPAGRDSATVYVIPKRDLLREGDEAVELKLVLDPPPGLGGLLPIVPYEISSSQSMATVVIQDVPPRAEAGIELTSPKAGDRFTTASTVELTATAFDPAGAMTRVEFVEGDRVIGVSEVETTPVPPRGTPIEHRFQWKNPPAGSWLVGVRGRSTVGTIIQSPKIPIVVVAEPLQPPEISIVAVRAETEEPAGDRAPVPLIFRLERRGETAGALRVFLDFSGSAQPTVDYRAVRLPVDLPLEVSAVEVSIVPTDDTLLEGDETILVEIRPNAPGTLTSYNIDPARAQVRLVLRDSQVPAGVPVVSLTAKTAKTEEPAPCVGICPDGPTTKPPPGVFLLKRRGLDHSQALLVPIDFEGSAKAGSDYILPESPVQIPAGSEQVEIEVRAKIDDLLEPSESVIASIAPAASDAPLTYVIDPVARTAQVLILDTPPADALPLVSLTAERTTITEPCPSCPHSQVDVTLARLGPRTGALPVVLEFSGTALPGADYVPTAVTQTIPAGASSVTFAASVVGDRLLEGDETLRIRVLPQSTYQIGDDADSISFTLRDNVEGLTVVSLEMDVAQTTEPSEDGQRSPPAAFFLKRLRPAATPLTVQLDYGGTARGTGNTDYRLPPSLATIAAGADRVRLEIEALGDFLQEGDETVEITLNSSLGETLPGYAVDPTRNRVSILLRDAPREGLRGSIVLLTPQAQGQLPAGNPIAIEVETIDPNDCLCSIELLANGLVVANSTVRLDSTLPARQPVLHQFEWNNALEGRHLLTVRGTDSLGQTIVSSPITIVVGEDRPQRSVVRLWATVDRTTEEFCCPACDCVPSNPAPALLSLTREADDLSSPLTVRLQTSGAAVAGRDYLPLPESITFSPGQATLEVPLPALWDDEFESDESVIVTLLPAVPMAPTQDYALDSQRREVTLTIVDRLGSSTPFVAVVAPSSPSSFTNPDSIEFRALVRDPKNLITTLAWYAGAQYLGESTLAFSQRPDVGTSLEHRWVWPFPPAGDHSITARIRENGPEGLSSTPTQIKVVLEETEALRPRIALRAKGAVAIPGTSNQPGQSGTVVIERQGGPANLEIQVFIKVDGSARPGTDYQPLSSLVILPAGQNEVSLEVVPYPTTTTSTLPAHVDLTLLVPPCNRAEPASAGCYRIGDSKFASVVVQPAGAPPAAQEHVRLLEPKNGQVFSYPGTVRLLAQAWPESLETRPLEWWIDGKMVAVARGALGEAVWQDPTPGAHQIVARLPGSAGSSTGAASPSVEIFIHDRPLGSVSERRLPPVYVGGEAFTVFVHVEPAADHGQHIVYDTPPEGWEVSEMSESGRWDATAKQVVFGPFRDQSDRTLSYQVNPSVIQRGPVVFRGWVIADGRQAMTGGDQKVLSPEAQHPADREPPFFVVQRAEAERYGAAWASSSGWPSGPIPISIDYVTLAGSLARSESGYRLNATVATPALRWLPVDSSSDDDGIRENSSSWAQRELIYDAGQTVTAFIEIGEVDETATLAVEEVVPVGWQVSGITGDGVYHPGSHAIRWGPFFGSAPTVFGYRLTLANSPRLERFRGLVSINARSQTIGGVSFATPPSTPDPATLRWVPSLHEQKHLRAQVVGSPFQVFSVERSHDLRQWQLHDVYYLPASRTLDLEELALAPLPHFFRIRRGGP